MNCTKCHGTCHAGNIGNLDTRYEKSYENDIYKKVKIRKVPLYLAFASTLNDQFLKLSDSLKSFLYSLYSKATPPFVFLVISEATSYK